MARRDPQLIPAGPAEEALYEAVTKRYEVLADFFREVAVKSGNQPATEKKAFYRFIEGDSIPRARLDIYAEVLGGEDASQYARPVPTGRLPAKSVSASQLRRLVRAEVEAALVPLEQLLQLLLDRVPPESPGDAAGDP